IQVFSSVNAALTHVSTLLTCQTKSWPLDCDPMPLSSFIDFPSRPPCPPSPPGSPSPPSRLGPSLGSRPAPLRPAPCGQLDGVGV
ncbi:uncharacterized protein J3R85_007515, partial [Psidium guajava]